MAKERKLKTPSEIRNLLEESQMKFVMLNNRLFDDFYTLGKVEYVPQLTKELNEKVDHWIDHQGNLIAYSEDNQLKCTANFDERDFIIIILLKFLSLNDFRGYSQEIADYLGYSNKRIRERLKKLCFLQGSVNNIFHHRENERIMHPEGICVRMLNEEKVIGYEEGNIKRNYYKWHLNFDCDYKKEDDENGEVAYTPINFFKVTIYDLDLYTKGILNEKEFITYLYFIRSYNGQMDIWHSVEALSQKLNIKDFRITEKIINRVTSLRVKDKFSSDENEDFPLVHVDRPKNYEQKIRDRLQPSSYYKPIYNTQMCLRLNDEESNPYEPTKENEAIKEDKEDKLAWGTKTKAGNPFEAF
ncbi:hypothetical protein [Cytobacillus horneckiae]|uniref:Uncharacterized protein n=1 Tax=Cytobacillus horneckiae TaxID=549687 RepID=A0A2N0ZFA4_9BACI|nr:hypothetical protein [Cytobacillus horneckiae]MEC1155631.1 hypothetical protein [Cytobacillus horneckiae]MED2936949.1 hypothetical protein [Cytobacillus horneckiae]PKG28185.1 hypothetical protein CWS20_15185 [Cytobacillus horneckiae]